MIKAIAIVVTGFLFIGILEAWFNVPAPIAFMAPFALYGLHLKHTQAVRSNRAE